MKWKLCLLMLLCLAGCERIVKNGEGELRIAFVSGENEITRASSAVPDTSDFILSITDSKGKSIYKGFYGDCPESIKVSAGSYVVKAVSCEFSTPEFSAPQYGDEQCVVVPDAGTVNVKLLCRQMNAGVQLRIAQAFLTEYPGGILFLKSAQGKLMYSYSEKRIAYFQPGKVSLMLSNNGVDKELMSRTLLAQEVLSLGVSVASANSSSKEGRVSISVDTTRTWITDRYVIGGKNEGGAESSDAMTVLQARSASGSNDVWVCGYIVGGDLTSAAASFEEPFSSRTNILLGPKSSTVDKDACLSVQLPTGELRDALNLVDNPQLLKRKVYLRGDIVEAYFGIPGIKNVTEYILP